MTTSKRFPLDDRYVVEKIEAFNVAIGALEGHESAEPQHDGLDVALRERLANRLRNDLARWLRKQGGKTR